MLSDAKIRKAKGADKPYKLVDERGLHLYVTPAGSRLWRYRYEVAGKEKLLSLGAYPEIGLAEARAARDTAKSELRRGTDPGVVKRQRKVVAAKENADTFEAMAREWHGLQRERWSPTHAGDVLTSLEQEVFPEIGKHPVKRIGVSEILRLLRKIEGRGAKETARRVRQRISAVFQFAAATGRAELDPAASLRSVMAPLIKRRQPAITDLDKARKILADVHAETAHPVTKLGMRLLALTTVRPGTLAAMPWSEFDAIDPKAPIWTIPAARMKLRRQHKEDEARDHLVPLSRQALETIAALRTLTGRGLYVLPNGRSSHRPMSENAFGYLLNRAGYHHRHVPHGWRSTFSTVMNERYPADRAVIDFMLAHVPANEVESAYNRALYLPRRRELAQIWADLITEGLPAPESVLELPRRAKKVA